MMKLLSKIDVLLLEYSNKWAVGFILTSLLIICITSGSLFYSVVLETPYLSYPELPFKTMQETVRQGEIMPIEVFRCNKDKEVHAYTVIHSLVEINKNEITSLPPVNILAAVGCTTNISRANRIPRDTPVGVYKIFGYAEIKGTVKTFSIPWQTVIFKVTPAIPNQPITIINNNAAPLASKDRYIIVETKSKK